MSSFLTLGLIVCFFLTFNIILYSFDIIKVHNRYSRFYNHLPPIIRLHHIDIVYSFCYCIFNLIFFIFKLKKNLWRWFVFHRFIAIINCFFFFFTFRIKFTINFFKLPTINYYLSPGTFKSKPFLIVYRFLSKHFQLDPIFL